MPRNGTGTMTKAVDDFVNGVDSDATDVNTLIDDIIDEITNSVDKDGQTVYSGSHDWNGNKMIIDVDGDSKIGSDTDDEFDIDLAGSTNYTFSATTLNMRGNSITNLTGFELNDTTADHQYVFAVSELTADRTVTWPLLTGNDTLVFQSHAQTLTNKTLTSPVLTTPQLNDTSANHQYVFAVSELAADRTVTWPLLTGNDTLVFEDHTQTLTNKTLTSPDINGGTVDNTVIGGTTAAAGTFSTLNATGGGALTGTWSDLGTVTTIDIDGGNIDGTVIGATTPAAGTFSTLSLTTDLAVTHGGTGASNASGARSNLGLVIGTNVQAYSSILANTTASFTTAKDTKLTGIETAATADQTDAEIEAAYNNQVSIVSQAEAEAGTSTTARRWTAQRVNQAIQTLTPLELDIAYVTTITGSADNSIDFTALSTDYDAYLFIVTLAYRANNTSASRMAIQVRESSTWQTGASDYAYAYNNQGTTAANASASAGFLGDGSLPGTTATTATYQKMSGQIMLTGWKSSEVTQVNTTLYGNDDIVIAGAARVGTTAAIDGIRFMAESTSNTITGNIDVFGIRSS